MSDHRGASASPRPRTGGALRRALSVARAGAARAARAAAAGMAVVGVAWAAAASSVVVMAAAVAAAAAAAAIAARTGRDRGTAAERLPLTGVGATATVC